MFIYNYNIIYITTTFIYIITIMRDVWKHRYKVYRNETKQNNMKKK